MAKLTLRITPQGEVQGIYTDDFEFSRLGKPHIRRASHVEAEPDGMWSVDLTPVGGPKFLVHPDTGLPFVKRRDALAFEVEWLERNALPKGFQLEHQEPTND